MTEFTPTQRLANLEIIYSPTLWLKLFGSFVNIHLFLVKLLFYFSIYLVLLLSDYRSLNILMSLLLLIMSHVVMLLLLLFLHLLMLLLINLLRIHLLLLNMSRLIRALKQNFLKLLLTLNLLGSYLLLLLLRLLQKDLSWLGLRNANYSVWLGLFVWDAYHASISQLLLRDAQLLIHRTLT